MDPVRPFRIVTGVTRELLRSTGKRGIALAGEGPETRLFVEWMSQAGLPCILASAEEVLKARAFLSRVCLEEGGTPEAGTLTQAKHPERGTVSEPRWIEESEEDRRWATTLATLAVAARGDLVPTLCANKTMLVMIPAPIEPFLPLGDLYASEIHRMAGECSVPAFLQEQVEEGVREVDRSLRNYLEYGMAFGEAFHQIPSPLKDDIRRSLQRSRQRWQPRPLIPKLSAATLGADLDL
ncbi:hypothetical protein ACFL3S_13490 [Gemmatimonadota bacterium]